MKLTEPVKLEFNDYVKAVKELKSGGYKPIRLEVGKRMKESLKRDGRTKLKDDGDFADSHNTGFNVVLNTDLQPDEAVLVGEMSGTQKRVTV